MKKRRVRTQTIELGSDWDSFGGVDGPKVNRGVAIFNAARDLIISQSHKGPPFKGGGPFETSTCDIQVVPARDEIHYLYFSVFNWWFHFKGNFIPAGYGGSQYTYTGLTANFLRTLAKGTIGYDRYKPGSSDANVGQFIGELREIPTIPKTLKHLKRDFDARKPSLMKDFRRSFASDYLNIHFGWVPFLSDLRKIVKTSYDKSKIVSQLARDNGRPIRRRGPISDETSVQEVVTTGTGFPPVIPPISSLFFTGNWKKTVTTETTESYWFSARFRYYIPDFGSLQWQERFIQRLYGTNVSPELVYNLVPWTWAIDWFTNIGSTMSNFSPNMAENLTNDYAFVMEHRRVRETTVVEFNTLTGPKSCSISILRESKFRWYASPFGFGLTWSGFSPKQLAILAALGLSRS
jgi:hypothetical protein